MARVKVTCERCGGDFFVKKYRGIDGSRPARWCSRECSTKTSDNFWDNVVKSEGCWLWTGGCNGAGYGLFGSKRKRASHVAYEMTNGPIPEGLWMLHRCDNPPCVRPDHLFPGTPKDNTADMIAKGREGFNNREGENGPRAKLTNAVIPIIRRRRAKGETLTAIGNDFGVSPGAILHVVLRNTWKHIP